MRTIIALLLLSLPAFGQQPQSLPLYPVLTDAQQAQNRAAAAAQERAAMDHFARHPQDRAKAMSASTTYQSCGTGNCGSQAQMYPPQQIPSSMPVSKAWPGCPSNC